MINRPLSGWIQLPLVALSLLLSACQVGGGRGVSSPPDTTRGSVIDPTKSRFPLQNYSQSVDRWIQPESKGYSVAIMDASAQDRHFSLLQSSYFGINPQDRSPWNAEYITALLQGEARENRERIITRFLLAESRSWGSNFRLNPPEWKAQLMANSASAIDSVFHPAQRGMTLRETAVRALPTADPAYGDPHLAGQGYPFDDLQMSSIRPGTPVYVFTLSQDTGWKYVVSPSVMGWVKSDDVAEADSRFIAEWRTLAQKKLGAFIQEPVSVHDGKQFYFIARPGTILPFDAAWPGYYRAAIPTLGAGGKARLRWVTLSASAFTAMPWRMTPQHMATLMKTMGGKPYGWGNAHFYNDCSSEIRSLMLPFGIFLPRNSAAQIQAVSRTVDLTAYSLRSRLDYLTMHGRPFTTLVYIQGHIMLYIGNSVVHGQSVPMTYQNIWGLSPPDRQRRSIIGGAVFFPLLPVYPEDPSLASLAGKRLFKLGFID
ncbi:SH3 domain-containing protein [Edwardsiella piscicida]|uniref:SH3 domain-containing C40 family peptidase n=1 Tax=Edwardsiella piscicida TaxID=1263550 RepID=UPI0008FFCAC0|nr:SH3 domain-containing C40 family peptidase [Edwardsiella piscicida]EKS7779804.1 SH3 domain-containing protein [Edwardsiella piscicida]EKS7783226.1 SH3 domain-containing protein [Edwardsiella piscicida]UCQ23451.1 SH3 domain-containing protein [Edwardsiella piscicida]UCQ33657.1 SH3 domain-containing protein [Edwardsiella piscicida]UCQ43515.1 SH3 domain-containing protein [Edwardsiella piscicida]